jgi:hypothetical protein
MIRLTLLTAVSLTALAATPAAADEERFISITPDSCISVYETLVFTRRVGEVIVDADDIIAQSRHETLRERHGLEPNFLFFDQIMEGDFLLNSNTPENDERAVENIAACDREHGFTPVATLGRRQDLIAEYTCAVTFAIFARYEPDEAEQYSQLANYALQRHLAAATGRGDAVDPNRTLEQANQDVEARIARVQSGWERTEGLNADANACLARYRAEQAAAGQ